MRRATDIGSSTTGRQKPATTGESRVSTKRSATPRMSKRVASASSVACQRACSGGCGARRMRCTHATPNSVRRQNTLAPAAHSATIIGCIVARRVCQSSGVSSPPIVRTAPSET